MKRLLAIVAIVVVISAIVFGVVYFTMGLLFNGDASPRSAQAEQTRPTVPSVTRPTSNTQSSRTTPKVEGLVLRPQEARGQEITAPRQQDMARGGYEVQPGDSLYKIALAQYGDASYVNDIRNANPGLTDAIRPGQRIKLPPKHEEQPITEQRTVTPQIYTVRRGDTLIAIARRYYGDSAMYTRIFDLNRHQLSSPEALREGMVLKMPPQPQFDQ
ncbi:MAG: LysM peptidoglycan-binding domain-containing protein [Planctomycetes bacterium]|nr:LysM peptidoglycan-binding domain-containing protein [Planctomycetota bacterium]